jgi:hypothetical protein
MLGSGFLVQSEHVFLLFNYKLVLFSSNFFDLGTNFCGDRHFLFFGETYLGSGEFSSRKSAFSAFWQESFSSPVLAFHKLHLFLHAVTLPVFAVSIAIASALVL